LEIKLKAEKRETTGKGEARKSRARGEVPAVMYGLGEAPTSLSVKKEDLSDVLGSTAGSNVLLDLQVIDGKEKTDHLVMIKELQKHPFKERFLHVDFLKVARDEKITMKVPIAVTGEEESVGLKLGGTLQHNLWEVEIECFPTDVPDHLYVDIASAVVGDHRSVSDLVVPEDVTLLTDTGDVLLTILAPRLAVEEVVVSEEEAAAKEEAAAAAEAAAPEGGANE